MKDWLDRGGYRADADRVVQRVLENPENLKDLVQIVLEGGDGAQVQRAAMVLGNLARLKPGWLLPFLDDMLEAVRSPLHPAVRRNILRYVSELRPESIPLPLHGKTVDLAMHITDSTEVATASRVFAMQVVANFCALYPELAVELRACLEYHLPHSSPGIMSRGAKILARLPE